MHQFFCLTLQMIVNGHRPLIKMNIDSYAFFLATFSEITFSRAHESVLTFYLVPLLYFNAFKPRKFCLRYLSFKINEPWNKIILIHQGFSPSSFVLVTLWQSMNFHIIFEAVSPHSPCSPGTHYADQDGLFLLSDVHLHMNLTFYSNSNFRFFIFQNKTRWFDFNQCFRKSTHQCMSLIIITKNYNDEYLSLCSDSDYIFSVLFKSLGLRNILHSYWALLLFILLFKIIFFWIFKCFYV